MLTTSQMRKTISLLEWAGKISISYAAPTIITEKVNGKPPSTLRMLGRSSVITLGVMGLTKIARVARDHIGKVRWELISEIESMIAKQNPQDRQSYWNELAREGVIWNLGRLRNIRDDLIRRTK